VGVGVGGGGTLPARGKCCIFVDKMVNVIIHLHK